MEDRESAMEDPETTPANEPSDRPQQGVYGGWLRLLAEGFALQADIARGLTEASIESGQVLQRQYASLADAWRRTAARTGDTSALTAPVPAVQSTEGGTRSDVQVPRTADGEPTGERLSRQADRGGEPPETTPGRGGAPVVTGSDTGETNEREAPERARPASDLDEAELDPAADIEQIDTLGPEDAEQLRSADVHTIEQLATATPEELAAEADLHPRWVRVWVVRARRAYNR